MLVFQNSWGSCLPPRPGGIINEGSAGRELASASWNLLSVLAAAGIPEQGLALCARVGAGPGQHRAEPGQLTAGQLPWEEEVVAKGTDALPNRPPASTGCTGAPGPVSLPGQHLCREP